MALFTVPLLGALLWVLHLVERFAGRGPRWLGWAWVPVLPLLVLGTYATWVVAVPRPVVASMFVRPVDDTFLANMVLGWVEWMVFLLLEPAVHLVRVLTLCRRSLGLDDRGEARPWADPHPQQ